MIKDNIKTFTFDELTDDFYEKVIAISCCHSSGLGGPGGVHILTEDNKKYQIGFEGLEFNEYLIHEKIPMLAFAKKDDKEHEMLYETKGFVYALTILGRTLVRNDYYQMFKDEDKIGKEFIFDFIKEKLGGETEYFLYETTYITRKKEEEERLAYERHKKEVRIMPEEMNWKNISDSFSFGIYNYMFKMREDKLVGCKWSIRFQSKNYDSNIDAYNLFIKFFHEIDIPSEYALDVEEYVSENDSKFDLGEFLESFNNLNDAKEAIEEYNYRYGGAGYNKENIVKGYPDLETYYKNVLELYEPIVVYSNRYKEINEYLLNNIPKKTNAYIGSYPMEFINEMSKLLNISVTYLIRILNRIKIGDLFYNNLNKAIENVNEANNYLRSNHDN